MKLTIDLQDPEIQKSLKLAIEAKVSALASDSINRAIESVIGIKLERLTDKRIEELAAGAVQKRINEMLQKSGAYCTPTVFEQMIRDEARTFIREQLKR